MTVCSLLKHALHNTCPDMMKSIGKDEDGHDIKVRDSEGIQLANAKIDEIRKRLLRMARRAVAAVQGAAGDDVQPQVQLFRAPAL